MTAVPIDVTVTTRGADKLARVAAAVKASGDKDLQRELRRALSRTTKPLRKAAKDGALQILPHRGGLDEHVAATARIATRVTANSSGGRLRITGTSRDNLRRMDEDGLVAHPVFGNRKKWVIERVRPGWFTNPLTLAAQGNVPKEIDAALDDVARKLQAKI
jgi:hypothetical protein